MITPAELKAIKEQILREIEAAGPDRGRGARPPTKLTIGRIQVIPELFQQRRIPQWLQNKHRDVLAQAIIDTGKPLEAVVVLDTGARFILVDGHHRMLAYAKAGWDRAVPVRVLYGDLKEGAKVSLEGNSADKLAMSREEKSEAAWRFVCDDVLGFSRAEVAEAARVSDRLVGNMRTVKRRLMDDGITDLSAWTWDEARKSMQDIPGGGDFDLDGAADRLFERYISKIPDAALTKNPEVFLRMLERHLPEHFTRIHRELGVALDGDVESTDF